MTTEEAGLKLEGTKGTLDNRGVVEFWEFARPELLLTGGVYQQKMGFTTAYYKSYYILLHTKTKYYLGTATHHTKYRDVLHRTTTTTY